MPVYYLRNELWTARLRDVAMKQWLITLLEWHVLLRSDGTQDVWYAGRHLSTWLPRACTGVLWRHWITVIVSVPHGRIWQC